MASFVESECGGPTVYIPRKIEVVRYAGSQIFHIWSRAAKLIFGATKYTSADLRTPTHEEIKCLILITQFNSSKIKAHPWRKRWCFNPFTYIWLKASDQVINSIHSSNQGAKKLTVKKSRMVERYCLRGWLPWEIGCGLMKLVFKLESARQSLVLDLDR
ncbi:hypothetical protein M8C21_010621, partial [Ambrosia artemisiifolia]